MIISNGDLATLIVQNRSRSREEALARFRKTALTRLLARIDRVGAWSQVGTTPAQASRRLPRWWTESGRRQRPGVSVGVGTTGVRQCACDMAARRCYDDLNDVLHLAMWYTPRDTPRLRFSRDSHRYIQPIREWVISVERCKRLYSLDDTVVDCRVTPSSERRTKESLGIFFYRSLTLSFIGDCGNSIRG